MQSANVLFLLSFLSFSLSFSVCAAVFFPPVLRFHYSIVFPLIVFTAAGNSCENRNDNVTSFVAAATKPTPHETIFIFFFPNFFFRIFTTPSPPYNISCIHAHALTKRYVRNTHGYIIFVMFNSPRNLQFISHYHVVFSLP